MRQNNKEIFNIMELFAIVFKMKEDKEKSDIYFRRAGISFLVGATMFGTSLICLNNPSYKIYAKKNHTEIYQEKKTLGKELQKVENAPRKSYYEWNGGGSELRYVSRERANYLEKRENQLKNKLESLEKTLLEDNEYKKLKNKSASNEKRKKDFKILGALLAFVYAPYAFIKYAIEDEKEANEIGFPF